MLHYGMLLYIAKHMYSLPLQKNKQIVIVKVSGGEKKSVRTPESFFRMNAVPQGLSQMPVNIGVREPLKEIDTPSVLRAEKTGIRMKRTPEQREKTAEKIRETRARNIKMKLDERFAEGQQEGLPMGEATPFTSPDVKGVKFE